MNTTEKYDMHHSGRYILTTLRHEFNLTSDPRHKLYMECVKDSVIDALPSSGVQYQNNGSSRTDNFIGEASNNNSRNLYHDNEKNIEKEFQ